MSQIQQPVSFSLPLWRDKRAVPDSSIRGTLAGSERYYHVTLVDGLTKSTASIYPCPGGGSMEN